LRVTDTNIKKERKRVRTSVGGTRLVEPIIPIEDKTIGE
jgi:hypothetical protein